MPVKAGQNPFARSYTALSMLAFAVFLGTTTLIVSRPIENFVHDLAMSTISPFVAPPAEEIVVVAITEETLEAFPYRSPIDRGFLAALIARIAAAEPKVIGIDILFDQPTEPQKDDALETAILSAKQSGVPVVLAAAQAEDGLTPRQLEWFREFAPAAPRGLATLARDPFDGVVRGLFTGRTDEVTSAPGFALAMAEVTLGGYVIDPMDRRAPMIYYRAPDAKPFAFKVYPAHTAGVLPPAWFADKHVVIGVDLPIDDRHATPFIMPNGVEEGTLPGVVIHAHMLAQFLSGEKLHKAPFGAVLGALALVVGLAAWLCWRPFAVVLKPVIVIGAVVLWWAVAAVAFSHWAITVPVAAPSILIAGLASAVAFLAWKRDADERRFIQSAFGKYVSPGVVQRIVAEPASLRLGGERRTVTCVFTDLEGFTGFSETLEPERVAAILNAYLDRMCNLFVDHGATIDKVIGDALVGFFGAPASQEDDASMAVSLTLAVDRLSEAFRAGLRAEGIEVGVTRVGVHRGPAIVGNFGGERFFDYTAVGDTVNIAARLEGANKFIGTRLCVSGDVALCATGHSFRPSAALQLKGRASGIETFEPLDTDRLRNEAGRQAFVEAYKRAYALMSSEDPEARQAFAELYRDHPGDGLVALHATRLSNGETGAKIILGEK